MSDNNPESRLNIGQKIGLELLWGFSRLMRYAPRWFRYYIFKPFICLLLRLLRYRRKVILKNLALCFPEKSPREQKRIMRRFYGMLAEIMVDTISLAGATTKRDGDIVSWANKEEHMERVKGKDWIALAAHYGCWEYYLLWSWQDAASRFMGVYHTLRSDLFECFYRRLRAYTPQIDQVPMQETVRFYLRNRGKGHNIAMGLISDQSPRLSVDTEWYDFFGQPTAFVEGGAHIATKFSLPIYFIHVRRRAAGKYEYRFDEIYDGTEAIDAGEITRRYAARLEAMIRECPELWLWSHNRWRYNPERQAVLREKVKRMQEEKK